jgi:hypothetical protein
VLYQQLLKNIPLLTIDAITFDANIKCNIPAIAVVIAAAAAA